MNAKTALLRGVPDSFVNALVQGERPVLDVGRARQQHAAYRDAFVAAGLDVAMIEADEKHPDCCFIEDTAVVFGDVAVVARSGAESRRGETGPVAEFLAHRFELGWIVAPGTLDGGDVLQIGSAVFVGISARTNDEGTRQLTEVVEPRGYTVTTLPVQGVLHLKTAVAKLDDETVAIGTGHVDEGVFSRFRVIEKDTDEDSMASAVPLGNGRVMTTASAPRTSARIAAAGYEVIEVDTSEFQAADGGLTCLSILL